MSFLLLNTRCRSCYKTWKGNDNIINSAIPGNSRPLNSLVDSNNIPHTPFKPNPIKHWRKQLTPIAGSGNGGKASVNRVMEIPGGTVNIKSNQGNCSIYPNLVKTYINNLGTCDQICNDDRKKIIRSAKTNIDKKYYTTSSAYLRSRVKLHSQNQTISVIDKNNPTLGYNSVYCSDVSGCDNCNNCFVKVNYKPNNANYSQQGAVSSDLHVANLKYKTFETNKCSCPPVLSNEPCKHYKNSRTNNYGGKTWRKSLSCKL